jgi:hypothetical protein
MAGKHSKKSEIVTCPLCSGRGEMNKHLAVVRSRSPQFKETLMDFEDDVLTPPEDPFETHSTDNTPEDHMITRRSWKE